LDNLRAELYSAKMSTFAIVETVRDKFQMLKEAMTERMRRHWAASEAVALGRGGVSLVARATGMSRTTITTGSREVQQPASARRLRPEPGPSRRSGGGRKMVEQHDPSLLADGERLVEPTTRGDPLSPLRWTCKSTRQLAEAMPSRGHRLSYKTVATLLGFLGYSLPANRQTREGASHPDRNAQFEHSNSQVLAFPKAGQPVISVDTKKKEILTLRADPSR
jgi:hypothetical protein